MYFYTFLNLKTSWKCYLVYKPNYLGFFNFLNFVKNGWSVCGHLLASLHYQHSQYHPS